MIGIYEYVCMLTHLYTYMWGAYTKQSQTEKDKYYMISLLHGIWKIIWTNLFAEQKHRGKACGYQRGKVWGRDKLGDWGYIPTLIYV